MEEQQTDFFISYNYRDGPWAEWITWQLEQAGYTCVLQAWDFVPGANFVAEMHHALIRCHRVLAIVSAKHLTSAFVTAEWTSAYADDPDGKRRKLLPVRIEDIEISGLLKAIVYVDLVGKDEEAARQAIFAAAEVNRRKPDSAPLFPTRRPRVEFPETHTTANSGVVRFALVLTGTVDDLNRPLVEAMVKHLRQFAPDSQLTLEQIQRGSIVLTFRAMRAVFSRLQMWFADSHSQLLLGMTVKRMYFLTSDVENPASESRSPSETERGRFSDSAALYFALDEVLGAGFLCTLAAYLNFDDHDLRKATVRLLLDLAHFSDGALPIVLSSLVSGNSVMKSFIVGELGSRGVVGYAAVPALVALTPTTEDVVNAVVRLGSERPLRVAADTLAILEVQISPTFQSVVSFLLKRFNSGATVELDDGSVARVARSLSRIALTGALYDRIWAIDLLVDLQRTGLSFKEVLRVIVMDVRSDSKLCLTAVRALIKTGDDTDDLADRLIEIIKKEDDYAYVREEAVELLAIISDARRELVGGLISLLDRDDTLIRNAAVKALGSVGYNQAIIVTALTNCLSDEAAIIRENAEAALQRLRRGTNYPVLDLQELLAAEDETIRQRALEVLRDLRHDV